MMTAGESVAMMTASESVAMMTAGDAGYGWLGTGKDVFPQIVAQLAKKSYFCTRFIMKQIF